MGETKKRIMVGAGERVLLLGKKSYLVKAEKRKFTIEYGELDLGELLKKRYGDTIKTHKGEAFAITQPRLPDILRKIRRMPQIVTFKDAGMIVAHTGLCKEDVVVEAGGGSGALTLVMSRIAKQVHTYEIRPDFYNVVKENLDKTNVTNVDLKLRDVIKGIQETKVDVVMLDMASPEKVIKTAHKALKPGGFLVAYCPTIDQIIRFNAQLVGFMDIVTRESIEREWEVGEGKTRPKTRLQLGHTGFLTFARKA